MRRGWTQQCSGLTSQDRAAAERDRACAWAQASCIWPQAETAPLPAPSISPPRRGKRSAAEEPSVTVEMGQSDFRGLFGVEQDPGEQTAPQRPRGSGARGGRGKSGEQTGAGQRAEGGASRLQQKPAAEGFERHDSLERLRRA